MGQSLYLINYIEWLSNFINRKRKWTQSLASRESGNERRHILRVEKKRTVEIDSSPNVRLLPIQLTIIRRWSVARCRLWQWSVGGDQFDPMGSLLVTRWLIKKDWRKIPYILIWIFIWKLIIHIYSDHW